MLRSIVVTSLSVLAFVTPAHADRISFALGMSSEITVPVSQRVGLPALLVNTGTAPIEFGCLPTPCGPPWLDFGWGMSARGPDETMEPLHFAFRVTYEQFQNVTIPVGGSFPFEYGSILLNPATPPQHPFASFWIGAGMDEMMAVLPLTIAMGPELDFGPIALAQAQPVFAPIPEPATIVMWICAGAASGLWRLRTRHQSRSDARAI
jgi:hypothetical protein